MPDCLAVRPVAISEQAGAATPRRGAGRPRLNERPAEVAAPLLDADKLPPDAAPLTDTTTQHRSECVEVLLEGCVGNKFFESNGGPQRGMTPLPGVPTRAQTATPRSPAATVANTQEHCDDLACLTIHGLPILEEAGAATPQRSAGKLQPNEWPAEVATSRWDVGRRPADAASPTCVHNTQEAGAGGAAGRAAAGRAGWAAGGESVTECRPCSYVSKPGGCRNGNDLEHPSHERFRPLPDKGVMEGMSPMKESPPTSFGSSVAGSGHRAEDPRASLDHPWLHRCFVKNTFLESNSGPQQGMLSIPGLQSRGATALGTGFFLVDATAEEKWLKHQIGECQPCAYYHHKSDGCWKGDGCEFCHLCPKGELKKRKREKVKKLKREH